MRREAPAPSFSRARAAAWTLGLTGLALTSAGALFHDGPRFFHSYLFAYVFWLNIGLGAMALLMMHHLTSGEWGVMIRAFLLAATRTVLGLSLLALPLFAGLRVLFHWMNPADLAADGRLQYKAQYLNLPFFLARNAVYFASWIALSHFLSRGTFEREAKLRRLSGGGLVLYGLTASFFAIDWLMSLEPRFYSTMYTWIFLASEGLSAYALILLSFAAVSFSLGGGRSYSKKGLDDLGNILLAMIMVWAYLSFFQYLVTWMGNLPGEAVWYVHRFKGGWIWIGRALILFQFGAPFFILLFRGIKHHLGRLAWVAAFIFFMRFWDAFWNVMPAFHPGGWSLSWMDLTAWIGLGGVWFGLYLGYLSARPLFPDALPGSGVK